MKKLIVSGDSCTDLGFNSICHPTWDFSWPKWPEHVAKHLGMELVCLGKGGQGNQYIYSTLQDEIIKTPKEEIGLVIAGWTQCHRKDYQNGYIGRWSALRVDQDGDLINHIRKTMRHMISFQTLCERYNLPYMHFQMGNMFENMYKGLKPTESDLILKKLTKDSLVPYNVIRTKEKDLEKMSDIIDSYEPLINNHVNWPFSSEFGGDNMLDIIFDSPNMKELMVSELDNHPNEKGHKVLADELIKRKEKHGINNI